MMIDGSCMLKTLWGKFLCMQSAQIKKEEKGLTRFFSQEPQFFGRSWENRPGSCHSPAVAAKSHGALPSTAKSSWADS